MEGGGVEKRAPSRPERSLVALFTKIGGRADAAARLGVRH